jgi:hypothetical protein
MAADPDKPTLSERFTRAVIKADNSQPKVDEGPQTVEEIEEAIAHADDKERLIGLIAAPLACLIAFLVVHSLVVNDARSYSSLSLVLTLTLLVLAVAMMAAAWFRKRLYVGLAMALYGLSIFNLHFWEFGFPFVLFGSWYLVRAYRLQQKLRLAKEGGSSGAPGTPTRRARPNKRYTPPAVGPAKPPAKPPKPDADS